MDLGDLATLAGDRWFAMVPLERRNRLLARGRVVSAGAGGEFYAAGDPPDGLRAVLEGEVRLISFPALGLESAVSILGPGAWFGELSTLDGAPRPHNAVAFKPSRVLHITMAAFEALALEEAKFYRDLSLLVCARQRASLAFMSLSIAQPLQVRLARTIAGAARLDGAKLRIRQEDLAAMLGVSRQSINRALKRLETDGLVTVSYHHIAILDLAALRQRGKPVV